MLNPEVEGVRRSIAMSTSLPESHIRELIDTRDQRLQERVRIECIRSEFGPSWNRPALRSMIWQRSRVPGDRSDR